MIFGDRLWAVQPIRDVVLVTRPAFWTRGRQTGPAWLEENAEDAEQAFDTLERGWPGVRFEVPAQSP